MIFRGRYTTPYFWDSTAGRPEIERNGSGETDTEARAREGAGDCHDPSSGVPPGLQGRSACDGLSNQLLAALPSAEFERLRRHLVPVVLPRGRVLMRGEDFERYTLLPTSAVLALLPDRGAGPAGQVAMVGREGALGIPVGMGIELPRDYRCMVQIAGVAMRVERALLRALRELEVYGLLSCFAQSLLSQISQTRECNRRHPVVERLCRWMLMLQDRVGREILPVSPRFIWRRLGARCEDVDSAAISLQRLGLIDVDGEQVVIRDRAGLETAACGCYREIQEASHRLLKVRSP